MLDPRPICIKCKNQMSTQDSRGWEQLNSAFWFCPSCIAATTACQDRVREVLRKISLKIEEELVVG